MQTHDDLQVTAVSLATPVFLLFMSVGTVFGIGGTSVLSRALGEGRMDYAKAVKEISQYKMSKKKIFYKPIILYKSQFSGRGSPKLRTDQAYCPDRFFL